MSKESESHAKAKAILFVLQLLDFCMSNNNCRLPILYCQFPYLGPNLDNISSLHVGAFRPTSWRERKKWVPFVSCACPKHGVTFGVTQKESLVIYALERGHRSLLLCKKSCLFHEVCCLNAASNKKHSFLVTLLI